MRDRTVDILEAAVREFIASGEPISSSHLYHKYDFGIRPAMIRAELSSLTDEGFLEQPYHSSGRIPSNKGYEFYADLVLEEDPGEVPREFSHLLEERALNQLLQGLSRTLGVAGAIEDLSGETVYKSGLEALMSHLSWDSRDAIMEVVKDFEAIDERIARAREELPERDFIEVFIGKKSPVTKSNDLAVVAADYEIDGNRFCIFAIGPKRMDYEKAVGILKALKHLTP